MAENQINSGITMRTVSHKTGEYLRGIVGIEGWADFAIALKAYAARRQSISTGNSTPNAVYLMLMGYALENLAKCIIVYKAYTPAITDVTPFEEKLEKFEFETIKNTKCKLKNHYLHELYSAKDLGFRVSPTEIAHLKVISDYAWWKGRYPVPLEIGKMSSSPEPSFEDLSQTAVSIYDRAMAEVTRLRSLKS